MKSLLIVLFFLTIALGPIHAQDAPKPAEAPKSVPSKLPPEFDQIKIEVQNLILRRALAEKDYQLALQTLATAKRDADDYTVKAKAKINEVYEKLGIKIEEFDVNFETGDIVPAKK